MAVTLLGLACLPVAFCRASQPFWLIMTLRKKAAVWLSQSTLVLSLAATAVCGGGYSWQLPPGFLPPFVPADNPMSGQKVELGRHLFYDTRLSGNGAASCATCHQQQLAFTDGRARATGSTGAMHPRSSMSLLNVAYTPSLTWAHPTLHSLEEQALVPLLGDVPVEMGMSGRQTHFLAQARKDAHYQQLFRQAFAVEPDPFTWNNVVKALACFERSLVSFRSSYDRYRYAGEEAALSPAAKRGEQLFFSSERAGCFQCHGGITFSGAVQTQGSEPPSMPFHNTGLSNLPDPFTYAALNTGLHAHTGRQEDIGKFRTPTLRNIAMTAPYMHDGSMATLEDVVQHYERGGLPNPNKSHIVQGFTISQQERQDLIAFLHSLTDIAALQDPRWTDPWPRP